MDNKQKINILDSNNVSYNLGEKVGEGAQGITFMLEDQRYIVKLFNKAVDPSELQSKINFLMKLGLDRQYFSIPLKRIMAPRHGYISEFASGMIQMSKLKWNNNIEIPFTDWFAETGGILKRYNILMRLAHILRHLHSKGLTYCDLSPNNVFVSEKKEKANVFLIDLDNLRYKSSIVKNIYTPYYGAPEVVTLKSPNTTMSDCFSFAIIAYELLTFNHPFIGDYVAEGEPELEEEALKGAIPWIDNSTDDTNRCSTGIASSIFATKKLRELFRRTFEEGTEVPSQRPSMAEWFEALSSALDELVSCSCSAYYPYNNLGHCPFPSCLKSPDHIIRIRMRRWDEIHYDAVNKEYEFGLTDSFEEEIIVQSNAVRAIRSSHFLLNETSWNKIMDISVTEVHDALGPTDTSYCKLKVIPYGHTLNVATQDGNIVLRDFDGGRSLRVSKGNTNKMMFFLKDNLNEPQRVLTIDYDEDSENI